MKKTKTKTKTNKVFKDIKEISRSILLRYGRKIYGNKYMRPVIKDIENTEHPRCKYCHKECEKWKRKFPGGNACYSCSKLIIMARQKVQMHGVDIINNFLKKK